MTQRSLIDCTRSISLSLLEIAKAFKVKQKGLFQLQKIVSDLAPLKIPEQITRVVIFMLFCLEGIKEIQRMRKKKSCITGDTRASRNSEIQAKYYIDCKSN